MSSSDLNQIFQSLLDQAVTAYCQGKYVEASQWLDKGLELFGNTDPIRSLIGSALRSKSISVFRANGRKQAEKMLQDAVRLHPNDKESQYLYKKVCFMNSESLSDTVDNRLIIPYLEMDITYLCNLHCDYCSHYSNYTIKGQVDFAIGKVWLTDWSKKIYPRVVRLLGGEPTLNSGLCDYIKLIYELFPFSTRAVVSNGFFIDRQPDLFRILAETGTYLDISIHDRSPEYAEKANLQRIKEASLEFGFPHTTSFATPDSFVATYRGIGTDMRPFADRRPVESWKKCGADRCQTLHLGRLWKCPQIAFLNNIDERFGLADVPEWQAYLQHKGLGLDATQEDIADYIKKCSYFCGMCPANPVAISPKSDDG